MTQATEPIIPLKRPEGPPRFPPDVGFKKWAKFTSGYLIYYGFLILFFYALLSAVLPYMDKTLWAFFGIFLGLVFFLVFFIWRGTIEKHRRLAKKAIEEAEYEDAITKGFGKEVREFEIKEDEEKNNEEIKTQ